MTGAVRRMPGMAACLAALLGASCARPLMKLPSGTGLAAPDAADALREATSACRTVSTITAEIAVTGSIDGRRLRARLLAGLASPASARLEAAAPFGQPLFILVARGDDATLLLPRERRVLERERPEVVLEALAAVPLDAADLRVALTGCAVAPDPESARQLGQDWRVLPDGSSDLYLHRDPHVAPWRLVAVLHRRSNSGAWRAEYRDFLNGLPLDGLPRTIRLKAVDSDRFDLHLTLSQIEINQPLGAEVFRLRIPGGAESMTLEELKASGPLASRSHGR